MSGLYARRGRWKEHGVDLLGSSFLRDLDYQVLALFFNISRYKELELFILFNVQQFFSSEAIFYG